MKRILSVLLALVMVLSMIPVIASAATESATINFDANKTQRTSFSTSQQVWTEGNVTFTNDKASSSNAIADYSNPVRLYQGSSVTIAVAEGNITEILIVSDGTAKYKTALQNSITGAGATYTNSGNNYTITLDGSSASFTMSMTAQARFKSITVTYATVESGACTHANTEAIEAKDATCVLPGNTAGVKCADCGLLLEGNEVIEALGHTESVTDEKAATCTEDGYTQYTCSVCENVRKDYIDATGHSYVDGVCVNCGLELPTDLAGQYYIAAIRKEGNYWYMTNDVGTTEGKPRYQIVDSGVTILPESIEDIVATQLFELVAVDGGYVIKTGEKYLGWSSGNYGTVVDEANAKVVTIEYGTAEGSYNIHFAVSETEERYLALNSNADYAYYAWYVGLGNQITDLYLVPVVEDNDPELPIDPTDPPACEHTNTTTTTVDATCEEAGSKTVVCDDCGTTVSTETIDALGHSYTDGVCDNCGEEEVVVPSEATITFDSTSKRTEYSTSKQVWTENGVIVTNNKASSTSNVADYAKPARFYKSSDLIIEYPGLTKIVVACNTTDYAKALGNSVSGSVVDGKIVTIELDSAVDSYTITLTGGQVRVDSLTVYTTKVCDHVWSEAVQTLIPNCAEEGENTYTCTLCGETKTEHVAALGHDIVDGVCSVCSGNIYPLVTALNENDNVILYNPANKVAMGNTVNTYSKMDSVSAAASNGIAVKDGMGIMTVKYVEGSETDFYLMLDGKYLNAGATGNKMYLTEEADDYAIWYLKVIDEAEGLVYLNSRNAKYNDNMQSVEYYNGSFTTYSGSGDAFKMKLYVVPGKAEPAVTITHTSLKTADDALGFKMQVTGMDLAAITEFGFKVTVNGKSVEVKMTQEDEKFAAAIEDGIFTARLKNIMENNAGEIDITAEAYVVINGEKLTSEAQTTNMRQVIEYINTNWDAFLDEQLDAVEEYIRAHIDVMKNWNVGNIVVLASEE